MGRHQDYVKIILDKSIKTKTYIRSFNKIDNFLSYIGGLIGIFIMICFIINKYA